MWQESGFCGLSLHDLLLATCYFKRRASSRHSSLITSVIADVSLFFDNNVNGVNNARNVPITGTLESWYGNRPLCSGEIVPKQCEQTVYSKVLVAANLEEDTERRQQNRADQTRTVSPRDGHGSFSWSKNLTSGWRRRSTEWLELFDRWITNWWRLLPSETRRDLLPRRFVASTCNINLVTLESF